MRKIYISSRLSGIVSACIWLFSAGNIHAQTFRPYTTPVCPGQTEVYILNNIPSGYRLNNPTASGGDINNTPTISNGSASFQVRWKNANTGSVNPQVQKPDGVDANGNTIWRDVSVTPVSVGIKSVQGRAPELINGTTLVALPLCGGAQTVTLTVPVEYYKGAPTVPVTDYVWDVPAPFTVPGGQLAAGFSPARYLSGRSLTIAVPAGLFNATDVRVAMYVRDCNENSAYGNAPATLVSLD